MYPILMQLSYNPLKKDMFMKILHILLLLLFILKNDYMTLHASSLVKEKNQTYASNGLHLHSKIAFTLTDPFEHQMTLTEKTKKVIFVFSSNSEKILRAYLSKQDKTYLQSKEILVVVDISTVPSMIRHFFVLPTFKKCTYPILLLDEEKLANIYKTKENQNKITVVTLNHSKITSVQLCSLTSNLKTCIESD
jgi:hypothetical protein